MLVAWAADDVRRRPKSWAESVRTSDYVPFANVVNGAFLDYDWTDLVNNGKQKERGRTVK